MTFSFLFSHTHVSGTIWLGFDGSLQKISLFFPPLHSRLSSEDHANLAQIRPNIVEHHIFVLFMGLGLHHHHPFLIMPWI
ncbi:hypothetical protein ACJX0J_039958, partial [Zea mays]